VIIFVGSPAPGSRRHQLTGGHLHFAIDGDHQQGCGRSGECRAGVEFQFFSTDSSVTSFRKLGACFAEVFM